MKAKAISINEFLSRYNINNKWKEIIGDFLFDYTYFYYNNGNIKIYVIDKNVYNQLQLLKPVVLEKIKKGFEVNSLDIIYDHKKGSRSNILTNNTQTKYDMEDIRKSKEEKYKNVKNETLKKMLISVSTYNEARDKIFKIKGYKKCETCKEQFLPVFSERICIICRNEKEKKKIEFAKEKILENIYMSSEEAYKVYDIPKNIYKKAYDKILDNFYLVMLEKIEIEQDLEVIDLSEEIKMYVNYYTQSKDQQILRLAKTKVINRLKKSADILFHKVIEIKG